MQRDWPCEWCAKDQEAMNVKESFRGPISCAWCGKFRRDEDIRGRLHVSHDRLEAWYEPVCRWCFWFSPYTATDEGEVT